MDYSLQPDPSQPDIAQSFKAYRQATSLDDQVQALVEIGIGAYSTQFAHEKDSIVIYLKEVLERARQTGDDENEAESLMKLARYYVFQGKRECYELYDQARQIYERIGDPIQLGRYESRVGLAYYHFDQFDKALAHMFKALDITREAGDSVFLLVTYHNIADIMVATDQGSASIPYFEKSNAIERLHSRPDIAAMNADLLGKVYLELDSLDLARSHTERGLRISNKHQVVTYIWPYSINRLGEIERTLGNLDRAERHFKNAFRVAHTKSLRAMTLSGMNLARLEIDRGRLENSLFYLRYCDSLIDHEPAALRDLYGPSRSNVYHTYAQHYEAAGDYKNSLEYLKKAEELELAMGAEDLTKKLGVMHANYRFEQKQLKDSVEFAHKIEVAEQQRQAEQDKKERMMMLIVFVAIIAAIAILYIRQRAQQKTRALASELEDFTQQLLDKSRLQESLQEELKKLRSSDEVVDQGLEDFQELLSTRILTREDWMEFKQKFTLVYPKFFAQIRSKEANLTNSEERLLALEKLNLKTAEIANMLGVSPESVNTTRYRLRRKLNISGDVDILAHVES